MLAEIEKVTPNAYLSPNPKTGTQEESKAEEGGASPSNAKSHLDATSREEESIRVRSPTPIEAAKTDEVRIQRRVTPVIQIQASVRSFDAVSLEDVQTPEAGTRRGPVIRDASGRLLEVEAPASSTATA